jgi:hypothetical protein
VLLERIAGIDRQRHLPPSAHSSSMVRKRQKRLSTRSGSEARSLCSRPAR